MADVTNSPQNGKPGLGTPHLTRVAGVDDLIAGSMPGMAHFARTGPDGQTCRSCVHWSTRFWETDQNGYQVESEKPVDSWKRDADTGELKPRRCKKFYRMMGHTLGPAVPAETPACMFFTLNESAPPIERPARKRPKERPPPDTS